MKVLFDAECLQTASAFRGIGRYSLSLLKSLLKENKKKHDIHILLNGKKSDSVHSLRLALDSVLPQSKIHVWPNPLGEGCPEMSYANAKDHAAAVRQLFIEKIDPDHLHVFSHFEGFLEDNHVIKLTGITDKITISVTIYDFIPIEMADVFFVNQDYKKFYLDKLNDLKRANQIFAISQYTLSKVKSYMPDFRGNAFNISSGISDQFVEPEVAMQLASNQSLTSKPYVLCLGSLDPHKNIIGLAAAWSLLPQDFKTKYELVLVGSKSSFPEKDVENLCIKAGLEKKHFKVINDPTDMELNILYSRCETYIQPSILEGFGLPVAEAISCGALAIGSNLASLPEILKSPEAMFDPKKPEVMAAKIQEALSGSLNIPLIKSIQKENIRRFSWARAACRLLELIGKKNVSVFQSNIQPLNQTPLGKRFFAKQELSKKDFEGSAEQLAWISAKLERCENNGKPMPRVFIDISELVQRDVGTGVQRVTRAVLHGLMNRQEEAFQCIPVYGSQESIGYKYANEYSQKIFGKKFASGDVGISPEPGDIFLGLDLQHHVTRKQANYLSILADQGVRVIFYLYDLLPIQYPAFWPLEHGLDVVHHEWLNIICSFDEVICISATTAKYCRAFLANPPMPRYPYPKHFLTRPVGRKKGIKAKISHNLLGYDIDGSAPSKGLPPDAQQILTRIGGKTAFLMVGTLEPRKGQSQILQTFNKMWAKGFDDQLVLVGRPGWLMDDFVQKLETHPLLNNKIFWFRQASDEFLEKLYEVSTCLIAASFDEGFGLPIVEAARFGKPIIARDIEVFREIAGSNAFYFKGTDEDEIAQKIFDWKKLYAKGQHPKPNILNRTWKNHVDQLAEILKAHTTHSKNEYD